MHVFTAQGLVHVCTYAWREVGAHWGLWVAYIILYPCDLAASSISPAAPTPVGAQGRPTPALTPVLA